MTLTLDGAQWQTRFSRTRYDPRRWTAYTDYLVRRARSSTAEEIRDDYGSYVYWVGEISERPELVDAALLADFFAEFGRLAGNLGKPAGETDVEVALDKAIAIQRQVFGDVTGLHLAKAAFLGSQTTESPGRLEAIRQAVRDSPPGSDAWANAMVTLAVYHMEVSRYDDAVRTARELERGLPPDRYHEKFRCAALVREGMALFASFQDIERARRVLQEACTYADRAADDLQIARWVSTGFHYLGRIADVERRHRTALDLYLLGQKYQHMCPEEVEANAFTHLRIAEPLTAAGVRDHALDHLREASRLVKTASNIGSARLQVELGFATFAAAGGDLPSARAIADAALRSARAVGFWRGELLGLGYLLVLGVASRRVDKILVAVVRILRTALFGELRRNRLSRLLLRIPVVLPIAVRRMSRRGARAVAATERLSACPCPLHDR